MTTARRTRTPHRPFGRRLGTGVAVVCLGVLAGCSGGGDALGSGEFTVAGLSAALPAPDGPASVLVVDVDGLDEARGLTRPDAAGPEAADWYVASAGAFSAETEQGIFSAGPDAFREIPPDTASPLGWGMWDVSSFAELQGAAPMSAAVYVGAEGPLPTDGTTELADGVRTLGEGEDLFSDLEERGPLRPLGQPVRVGSSGDALLLTSSTPAAERFAAGEDASTLADREPLMRIAENLDEEGVVSAYLTDQRIDPFANLAGTTPEERERILEQLGAESDALLSQPIQAIGLGWSPAEDAVRTLAVYDFGTADLASDAAPVLERVWAEGVSVQTARPFSELYSVDSADVEESLVVLTLTPAEGTPAGTLVSMIANGEPVFASF